MAVLWLGTVTTAATTALAENIDHPGKPIIVTATRTAQTTEESLASVTVISRKDIERQQARSLEDLFRGVLGINVNNNGGPGKGTFLQMRGTESDHVLVLIDGIKAGSATSGTTAFENPQGQTLHLTFSLSLFCLFHSPTHGSITHTKIFTYLSERIARKGLGLTAIVGH